MNLHIITGGSRGLGFALADFLVKQGDHVVDISRSSKNKSYAFDLSTKVSGTEIIKKIFTEFPLNNYQKICLVNNAGMVAPVKLLNQVPENEVYKSIMVNLHAPFVLTSAFLNLSKDFSGDRIIANVSTGVAKNPKESWSVYCATKSGLESLSESVAKEFMSDSKVKVINFEPGIIDTEMQNEIRQVSKNDFSEVEKFISFKKDGQLLAPSKVAEALAQLILKPNLAKRNFVSVYDLI